MDSTAKQVPVYDSAALPPRYLEELIELSQYPYLLRNLVARNVKVRYRGSWLGVLWVILSPLCMTIVLAVVFSSMYRTQVENYPVYLLAGMVIWNLFTDCSLTTMRSLMDNKPIINKIHVPPSVFVLSSAISTLVIHLFELASLLLIGLVLGARPSLQWVMIAIPVLQTTAFALGIGLMLSGFVLYFRDIPNLYDIFLRIYFFISPVFYPKTTFGPELLALQQINPITHFMDGIRSLMLSDGSQFMADLPVSMVMSAGALFIGWFIFVRVVRDVPYRL
jgi:ABC-2 type transport system permease protein